MFQCSVIDLLSY